MGRFTLAIGYNWHCLIYVGCWESGGRSITKKKILIVEDEEHLLALESILLVSRGYEVKGVGDGQAGLDAVVTMKPDQLLLDIMLPGIDGYEVCRQIKASEATHHIPVIMLTAKKSNQAFAKSEQIGVDWYITKQFKSAMVI